MDLYQRKMKTSSKDINLKNMFCFSRRVNVSYLGNYQAKRQPLETSPCLVTDEADFITIAWNQWILRILN